MEHFIDSDSDDDSLRAPPAQRCLAMAVTITIAVVIACLLTLILGG